MAKPKLILLNGFAGAGKTTIAKRYISEHAMAMVIEGDELIVNIGKWIDHEDEARDLIFALIKAMIGTYLPSGNDVVLPYLVTNAHEAHELELIAEQHNAKFYEFVLYSDRADAIGRLLNRGTWGEAGLPPITEIELPRIEELMTKMESELEKRPNIKQIELKENDPEDTYNQLINYL